ncbi:MAG: carbohydrate porin [Azoarcus sp.]|jgi:hypothetical protein|nr:carbohydrate porin [Azoarcus sp.]
MLTIKTGCAVALVSASLFATSSPALAAPPLSDAEALKALLGRIERLEERNAQLEQEVRALRKENPADSRAAKQSERPDQPTATAPQADEETETPAQETAAQEASPSLLEKLSGIEVDAALTTVWQKANGLPHGAKPKDRLNYRADLAVKVPLETTGNIEHSLFAHVRLGQGQGINETLGYLGHFNVTNAAAFHASGANADDSTFILGEAYYQAAIPMPWGMSDGKAREKLELTLGKMDIFSFFDQNEVAGDEATQFLNVVFVHNPLLDALGEVGADANGFQPGAILSYLNERNESAPWRVSLGIFGAGEKSSNYQETADSPLTILQAEKGYTLFGERQGNVRLYGWTRRNVPRFSDPDRSGRHTGLGISLDQEITEGLRLFARYGKLVRGKLPVDRTLAAGLEVKGNYWKRPKDALGAGASWLWASRAYRRAGGEGYLNATSYDDGNGTPDFHFTPRDAERVAELYYRFAVTPNLTLTPDAQWIWRGGANPHARTVRVFGVRANISY